MSTNKLDGFKNLLDTDAFSNADKAQKYYLGLEYYLDGKASMEMHEKRPEILIVELGDYEIEIDVIQNKIFNHEYNRRGQLPRYEWYQRIQMIAEWLKYKSE
jgi:hypothetical protein